jgi:long-chain acyl-CoA synthetase
MNAGGIASVARSGLAAIDCGPKHANLTGSPPPMLIGQMLTESRRRDPDKVALWFGDRSWTYAELDASADRVAGGLSAAGVQTSDRVATLLPNCPELLLTYLACLRLGAIAVPMNYRYRRPEAEYALTHSGAETLIVHCERLDELSGIDWDKQRIARRFVVGGAGGGGFQPFERLSAEGERPPTASFDESQRAAILYTSGTTAKPKGVVYSHATLWNSCVNQSASGQFTADDVHLVTTSASHAAAFTGQLLPNIYGGGTSVLMDRPTAADVVAAIGRHRVTRIQMLPANLEDLVEHLEKQPADVSSLRSCFAGGDVVPLDLHRRFRAVAGIEVSEVCGMTESLTYCMNPPFGGQRIGSVGRPIANTEVRIVEAGHDVPVGQTGEIAIRSAANFVEYWRDPSATAAAVRDGWLLSGDLGRLDEDGFLWFVGRRKEIIIRGGSNISPLEVEEAIDEHPAVHLSGVVGAPDKHFGQIVVAYVHLRPAATARPSVEELRQFVSARIAAYKVPEHIFFLDDMPLNATGKVDRHKLHERLADDLCRLGDSG